MLSVAADTVEHVTSTPRHDETTDPGRAWDASVPEGTCEYRFNPARFPKGEFAEDLHMRVLTNAASLGVNGVLDTLDGLADLDAGPELLLASMAAAQRAEARAAALKAHYATKLAERDLHTYADRDGVINILAEEVAMTLGATRMAADRIIRTGVVTSTLLTATGAAMRAGTLMADKAWVIVDALGDQTPNVAWAVEALVLPTAPQRTTTELRRDIARALIEIDPDDADERHRTARDRRHVTRPQPLPNSMARISVVLPADQAVTVDAALNEIALAAHSAGDPRSLCHLRVDALADWATTVTRDGWDLTTLTGSPERTARTQVQVTVPLELLAATLPGWTPPPSVAEILNREIHGPDGEPQGDSPAGGHRSEAAWLEGYGPVAPVIALLLAAGGTWRRLVTDPLSGAPLNIGRARYAPPANIATAVRFRDHVCSRPGCSAPASRCELDHVHTWACGGDTSVFNLTCLCCRCHRIKTLGGGGPGPLKPDGTRDWITADGRQYTNHPHRQPRQRGGPPPAEPPPEDQPASVPDDAPPPF